MLPRFAWFLTLVSGVCAAADTWITVASRPLNSERTLAVHGWPLVTLATVGASAMGALIISRYPRHPIGWLFCVVGVTSAMSMVTEAFAMWHAADGRPGSMALANVAAWISTVFGGASSLTGLTLIFLLVPDGHLLSRRWRYVAWTSVAGFATFLASLVLIDPTSYTIIEPENASATAASLSTIGFLFITVAMVASVTSLVIRFRRSRGRTRQQLRLIVVAGSLVAVGLATLLVVQLFNGGKQTWAAGLPLFVSYFLLPILFAFAVLRYRLYEIEIIISRAALLAVATAFAAIGYVAVVVGVNRLVDARTESFWISLLATTLVALAFQPLRRGAVRLANRLAFGARAAPYHALADFNRRLEQTPSPTSLLPALAEAAGEAVSARRVRVALWVDGETIASAVRPADAARLPTDHRVGVRSGGVILGVIELALPRGQELRPADERMVRDLADQAAPAFRNAALTVRLQEQVAALKDSTAQLMASRRRIIEAEDVERRRLEEAINKDVLPPLEALPEQIADVRLRPPVDRAASIEALVSATNEALASLRELTRGVFPPQLVRSGLSPTLRSLTSRHPGQVDLVLDPSVSDRRFTPRLESTVYFCCVEAIRRASSGTQIGVRVEHTDLVVRIEGAPGLLGIRDELVDRVESVGGTVVDEAGVVEVRLPTTVRQREPAPV